MSNPVDLVTESQRVFAQTVRDCLANARVSYSEQLTGSRHEAWYDFEIATTSSDLTVEIVLIQDRFGFLANSAALYLDLVAFPTIDEWRGVSISVLNALLREALLIRVRRTWFGRSTGAVWIPGTGGSEGCWNGDRAAYHGRGVEHTFAAPWYRSA